MTRRTLLKTFLVAPVVALGARLVPEPALGDSENPEALEPMPEEKSEVVEVIRDSNGKVVQVEFFKANLKASDFESGSLEEFMEYWDEVCARSKG